MVIEIDGSVLEGGGQIIRMSFALSALCRIPIKIQKIRQNRKNGGLAPQHLTGLRLVKDLCDAQVENDFLRSTSVTFIPQEIKSGKFVADTQTGGSVALLLQTSLPCILFGTDRSYITLKGGTNADFAPPVDYTINVLKPMLQKFGVHFDCEIIRRGFFQGNGAISVSAKPVSYLCPIDLVEFGKIESIDGEAYVAGVLPFKMAEEMAQAAENVLKGTVNIKVSITPRKFTNSEAFGNGSGICIFARTTTGCYLGSSALGKKGVKSSEVGSEAAELLLESIDRQWCADSKMQDQLILYMTLAAGKSRVKVGPITSHTETAIHISKLLTTAKFNIIKIDDHTNIIECDGIGLKNNSEINT